MKLVEKTFRLDEYCWKCKHGKNTLSICDDSLRIFLDQFWVVPGEVCMLTFSLHDRPSVDRIEVQVREDRLDEDVYPVLSWGKGEDNEFGSEPDFDSVFKPFVGRKLRFQVEYVEG